MKKPTWNTEIGRQMWEEGKSDSQIADEFRISAAAVASFRKKHWEKTMKPGDKGQKTKPAAEQDGASSADLKSSHPSGG